MQDTNRLDYARFGRQIALAQIGARGQTRLAEHSTTFVGGDAPTHELAASLYRRAGGHVIDGAETTVSVPSVTASDPARWAIAAWAAVEGARRALGEAPLPCPPTLLARFDRGPGAE